MTFSSEKFAGDTDRSGDGRLGDGGCKFGEEMDMSAECLFEKCVPEDVRGELGGNVLPLEDNGLLTSKEVEFCARKFDESFNVGDPIVVAARRVILLLLCSVCRPPSSSNVRSRLA